MRDRVPEMEYVFMDTQKELPETYEYLSRLEAYLGRPVIRLNAERGFDHWLEVYGGYLPSSRIRWCTRQLKIRPFEKYVGDDPVINYVGIRADENREGYISTKPNITSRFPFKEAGIKLPDVMRILEEAGLGLPKYYEWRSRSGCYFCFFQRKGEWAGLLERHPDLFEKAKEYEKIDPQTGERYTWQHGESLAELQMDERLAEIKHKESRGSVLRTGTLAEVFANEDLEDDQGERACLVCEL